jgi:hypothetical protein
MTPEGKIQRECFLVISQAGGIPLRLQAGTFYTKQGVPIPIGIPGLPDSLALLPNGRAVFLEYKTAHGSVREDQKRFIEELHRLGFEAYVVRSKEEAEDICNRMK